MKITRITRKYVSVALTVRLRDGQAVPVTAAEIATTPRQETPTGATSWAPADVVDGVVTFLVAGPDAAASGALVVPGVGCDVWGRVTDAVEVDAERLVEITVY